MKLLGVITGTVALLVTACYHLPSFSRSGEVRDVTITDQLSEVIVQVNAGDEVRWTNKYRTPVRITFADYILDKNPDVVTLVAMGERGLRAAPEDEICADYLEHLLTGKAYDAVRSLQRIVFHPSAQKFLLGTKAYLPREDPIFCLQRDLFHFVLIAKKEGGLLEVRKAFSSHHSSL